MIRSMPTEGSASLTIAILREIRDEIRHTNERLDLTNERLDQTNGRLDQTNGRLERLERRQTETEVRLATEIGAVASAVNELADLFRKDRIYHAKVDEHDKRIADLERKVG